MRIQAHGPGKRARIGAPSIEALVGSKTPAGGRTCRAGRGAHSAHRPVHTGKGGLSTEREQGRVRSDSTPGEATGQARAWRIYAHLLARAATMSHLSMAWGVPRGRLLGLVQISPGRAGSVRPPSQNPYQRESIYKDMPSKPRALEAIIRKWAGRSASAHLASLG